MSQAQKIYLASIFFVLSIVSAAAGQTAPPEPQFWLLQSTQITGDIREGFRKNCLIVYSSGEYHREQRRQLSRYSHAEFEWDEPHVSEARLPGDDFDTLKAILETPEFAAIKGAVGDARRLAPAVAVGPLGAVTPEENIDIVTIATARTGAPQVFEIADLNVARRQPPLRAFLDWMRDIDRVQLPGLTASQATNCSPPMSTGNAPTGGAPIATGMSPPRPIYTLAPRSPQGGPKPQPIAVELLVGPDGSVVEASLKGHPGADVAQRTLDAARKWKFEPARLLGVPIASKLDVKIEFRSQ